MIKKIAFVLLVAFMTAGAMHAKPKKRVVYMFGVSASFTDSIA